jgi:N-acetylneuraminic acid mutarotase
LQARTSSCLRSFAIFLLVLGAFAPAHAQTSTANQWTWMGGSNTLGATGYQTGVFGTLGVASPTNFPGSRIWPQTWTDTNGNLWLFGGFLAAGNTLYYLNDLWKYDPKTNEWTWMSGSNAPPCAIVEGNPSCGQAGVYGAPGTAAAGNTPGGREYAASWTDANGHLWLFGGNGFDSSGNLGVLNDLWELDPSTNQWTWQGGGNTVPGSGYGLAGVFGTEGVFSSSNHPGGLMLDVVWHDHSDHAWLFGGWGDDATGTNGLPNNLWQFESSPAEWAWMDGSSNFSAVWPQPTVYGAMGTPAAGNLPGSRWEGTTWTGPDNKLWLFGGQGYDSKGNSGYLNEFWQYDPSTNEWAWMAGNSTMNCAPGSENQNCGIGGAYGTLGVPSAVNLPGGRTDASQWTDADGNFWLFGGYGYNGNSIYSVLNDLWKFDPQKAEWTWIGGSSLGDQGGTYGTLGTPSSANMPGSRHAAASWTDLDGNLWLFGGNALDANGTIGEPNDFWRYTPATTTTPPPPPPPPPADFTLALGAQAVTVKSGQSTSTTLTITPQNSFSSAVSFTCSGLPAGAACSFSPATVTPSGSPGSATLTVSTSATTKSRPGSLLPIPAAALALLLFCTRRKLRLRLPILLVLTVVALSTLTACASYTLANPVQPIQPVVSTVTVTAQSGSLIHSATLTLTIE